MAILLIILSLNLFADQRLEPYIQAYKKDRLKYLGSQELNYKINFKIEPIEDEKTIVGRCIRYKSGRRDIIIDEMFFDLRLDCVIKLVVYHEIAHCELDKKHVEKDSIMLAKVDGIYKKFCQNEDYYIKKLFTDKE